MDVDQQTGLRALVRLSHAVDLEFLKQATKRGPLFVFMYQARQDAIAALSALVNVEATDAIAVRGLQNEVKRFLDTVEFTARITREGYEAAVMLRAEEDELRDIVAAEGGDVPGEDE